MDSFEFNKVAGAVLASLLMLLGVGMFLVPTLYAPTVPEQKAFIVEGVEEEGATGGAAAEAPVEQPIEALIAMATVDRGERVARRCVACHTFSDGGENKIGPNLWNIMGDKKAHLDNFNYSGALAGMDGIWDWDTMDAFLKKPSEYVPGTIMSFAGLNKPEDRAAIMVYLAAQAPTPFARPAVPAAPAAPEEAAAEATAEEAIPAEAAPATSSGGGDEPERNGRPGTETSQ
ncbi:MAG: c-type cytochrome [Candidatus Phaeomarinobacter sp.]